MTERQMTRAHIPSKSLAVTEKSMCGLMLDLVSCGGTPKEIDVPIEDVRPVARTLDQLSTDELMEIVAYPENYLFQRKSFEQRQPPDNMLSSPSVREQREQEHNVFDVMRGFFGLSEEPETHFDPPIQPRGRHLTREEILFIIRQKNLRALVEVTRKETDESFHSEKPKLQQKAVFHPLSKASPPGRSDNQESKDSKISKKMQHHEPDLLDDLFEGRIFGCGISEQPSPKKNKEQIKQLVQNERDLLGSTFKGRNSSGYHQELQWNPKQTSNVRNDKDSPAKVDERDLLDDVFEGRMFPSKVPENTGMETHEDIKRLLREEQDLLDSMFEGRGLSKGKQAQQSNAVPKTHVVDKAQRSKTAQRLNKPDLLDDVFEGRVFPCTLPEYAALNKNMHVKQLLHNDRDLLDDVFEGRVFAKGREISQSSPQNKMKRQENLTQDEVVDVVAFPERLCDRQVDQQRLQKEKEKDGLQTFVKSVFGTYKTKSEMDRRECARQIQPKQVKVEERDLLDDVFEGRLCVGSPPITDSKIMTTRYLPEKDPLDQVFETVEQQVCGVDTYDIRPDKGHRSLIDDATTVGSLSYASRQGLGLSSEGESKPHETKQKKSIIHSFFSMNGK